MTQAMNSRERYAELQQAIKSDSIWQFTAQPSEELIIFVHGYARGAWDYRGLIEALRDGSQSDIYPYSFDANPFCTSLPEAIATDLSQRINGFARQYQRIHLCGHSFGCLVIRAAVLHGLKNPNHSDFAAKIISDPSPLRITQLAGTNRGYKPTNELQAVAIEFIHRWLWFALLMPIAGWWLYFLSAWTQHQSDLWCIGVTSLLAGWCIFRFWIEKIRDARLFAFLSLPVLWSIWSTLRNTSPPLGSSWMLDLGIVTAETLIVLGMGTRLGFSKPVVAAQSGLAFLVAGIVAGLLPSIQWMWPMTFLFALPALLYPFSTGLLVEHLLYGSAWIIGVRLHWLEAFAELPSAPPIVHIFGEEDNLVSEDDHLELAQRGELLQIALPGVQHAYFELTPRRKWFGLGAERTDDLAKYPLPRRAIEMVASPSWTARQPKLLQQGRGPALYGLQAEATAADIDLVGMRVLPVRGRGSPPRTAGVQKDAVQQESMASTLPQQAAGRFSHVVFLIHGIRDYGEWQDSLGMRIREFAEDNQLDLHEVVSVRYGYFSAFQFLFSGERERATRTFLDLYTQTKARYPSARCHVAAHSNGTYVIGTALLKSEFVSINNLYLAGSVLRPEFEWDSIHQSQRLAGHIRSDRAAWDWPVGVLCWSISKLNYGILGSWAGDRTPWRYLGGGGVDGFKVGGGSPLSLTENFYLPGDHGEGLRPKYHDEIAQFLFYGSPGKTSHPLKQSINYVWRFGIVAAVAFTIAGIATLYLVTGWIAPADPLWSVLVGALITLLVIRTAMAV